MLLLEIKDFNALIDNKPFFDYPVKKQEAYENLWKCQIPQRIIFLGKLGEDDGATMCVIAEKQPKIILNFPLDSLLVTK